MEFSVCMCVYHKDNARDFRTAVESVYENQTIRPSEIIIVADGPVYGELDAYVSALEKHGSPFKIIRLKNNQGHAVARQTGLGAASNEWVAIMDADDISVPNRFELQLREIAKRKDTSVIGGLIKEFDGSIDNVVGERDVPPENDEICHFLKSRCPMNLVTVMFRKSDVQAVGGFIDWYCEEDYYLWVRLALKGYKFYNIQEDLVNVRVGDAMYQRRGGWKYFRSEARLQGYMLRHKIICLPRYLYNVIGRFAIQVIMPNKFRGYIYQKLFRK